MDSLFGEIYSYLAFQRFSILVQLKFENFYPPQRKETGKNRHIMLLGVLVYKIYQSTKDLYVVRMWSIYDGAKFDDVIIM